MATFLSFAFHVVACGHVPTWKRLRRSVRTGSLAALLVFSTVPAVRAQAPQHPLDPLSATEIRRAVSILEEEGRVQPETRFALIDLHEPPKSRVREDLAGGTLRRRAYAQMYDWSTTAAAETVVDLADGRVVSWTPLKSREPPSFFLVFERIHEILRGDERWHEAMRRRGITDDGAIGVSPGGLEFGTPMFREPGDGIMPVNAWVNNAPSEEESELHLEIEVDLREGVVTHFEDQLPPEVPEEESIFEPDPERPALEPLGIEQPDGPSFEIRGSRLTWQKWEMRFGVHPRRGLELYNVAWRDGDRLRSILYHASVSEMVAPYGDPDWVSFYPADEGGRGMALLGSLRSAEHGEDTPPNAVYRSAVTHDGRGIPMEIDSAVSIYERDDGLLWRHHDEARRSRALVLTSFHTVDNYDYQLSWIFREDGSIEVEALLTGLINWYSVERRRDDGDRLSGAPASHVLVAPGVAGPIHQHFFSYRLDFDLDGMENRVVEMNTVPVSPEGREDGDEWFATEGSVLRTEREAKRPMSLETGRWWRIVNPAADNGLGQHPGYALLPGHNAVPHAGPASEVRRAFGFLDAHLWVTAFDPAEMYAAGRFVNFDQWGQGLPRWIRADRSVEDGDVVVWYTLGITHLPRPEDWPIMPSRRESFRLVPFGFFTENPSMGVPRPHPWR